jgi:hypothetical protein
MIEPIAGFLLGFFGSLHCVGMCGPLVLALPGGQLEGVRFYAGRLLYNSGRVIMYALLGGMIGAFGSAIRFSGLQQGISVAAGVLVLIAALFPGPLSRWVGVMPGVKSGEAWVRERLAALIRRRSLPALLLIGFLNGFLPCGFVYVALGAATTAGSVGGSVLFMAGFGVGTVPVLLAVSLLGRRLGEGLRRYSRRLIPVLGACLALLFILRGMNLGIPYVSPKVTTEETQVDCCH